MLAGNGNLVLSNHITRSLGCPDGCGFGITFEGGKGNTIAKNLVARAIWGVRLDAFTGDALNTLVRDNVVRAAERDNIVVDLENVGPVRRTWLQGNVATGAGDDGIDVNARATTLEHNVANRNGDLGIEAVNAVTDARGNRAYGNGDPRQCTNVGC